MFIKSIELLNYRNYGQLHMEFHEGTNVLYGDNAQGKTNILEAIYVCCTTKSHKSSKDKEIIRFGTGRVPHQAKSCAEQGCLTGLICI